MWGRCPSSSGGRGKHCGKSRAGPCDRGGSGPGLAAGFWVSTPLDDLRGHSGQIDEGTGAQGVGPWMGSVAPWEMRGIAGFPRCADGLLSPLRSTGASERMSETTQETVRNGLPVNKYGVFKLCGVTPNHGVIKKFGWFQKYGRFKTSCVLSCLLGLSLLLTQCSGSEEPKRPRKVRERIKRDLGGRELGNIGDKRHSVINPSKRNAEATGIGCGPSRADAIKTARRVAMFNLRGVTGSARYKVEFKVVDEKPGVREYCLEMSAKARP